MPRRRHHRPAPPRPSQLTAGELALLRRIKEKPLPKRGVPKSMSERLWRWGYLRERLLASPDPEHYGAQIEHYQLTEQGHRELATTPEPPAGETATA